MSTAIKNSLQAGEAKVTTEGQLIVSTERDATTHPERIGGVKLFTENDNGEKTGTPYLKSPETSPDYRLRVGVDNLLFEDAFNATTQNTSLWSYTFATMTAAQPGAGTVNFGVVQGTTNAHGAAMRTFQYFPITATSPLAIEIIGGLFISKLVGGEVWRAGIGLPGSAILPPTDGVCMQLTSAGIELIISFNGTEVSSGILIPYERLTLGIIDKLMFVIGEHKVELWHEDVFIGEMSIPAGNGLPFQGVSAPLFMMKYNTSNVSNTNQVRISRVSVSLMDIPQQKPWGTVLGSMGRSGYQGQNGMTMGSTAGNFGATAALVATQAGSNTAPNAAMAGLGGLFQMTAQASSAGASGDMVAQYFQNPASTMNLTGRNLMITGVTISTINYGAVIATTPTTLVWGLAYGHTAVSLATAESASFTTATTHAPRRIALPMQYAPVGTVIGQPYSSDINMRFDNCPICVRPGEFIATTVRFLVGTATPSQTIVYTIAFDSYFE